MRKGTVMKSAGLREGELELINSYARVELGADEVFVFSVVLCDNEVDRDFERFTVESLEKLGELFVGKTGIFDHVPRAENQSARIISCSVENVAGEKNSLGDDYFRLVARAYMPVTDGNAELRAAIDSGILREVSVGCAVEKTLCSICGNELGSVECSHQKGREYGGKLCYGELTSPYDAYEFSFVAVPAQRGAGVIKSFFGKDSKMNEIIKSIEKGGALSLTERDCEKLRSYIEELRKQAADGAYYRGVLLSEVLRCSALVQPEISKATIESAMKGLSLEQLREVGAALKGRLGDEGYIKPQLMSSKDRKMNENTEFKI